MDDYSDVLTPRRRGCDKVVRERVVIAFLAVSILTCVSLITAVIILKATEKTGAPLPAPEEKRRETRQESPVPDETAPRATPPDDVARVYTPRVSGCRPGGGPPAVVSAAGARGEFRGLAALNTNEFAVCWNEQTRTPAWTAHRIGKKSSAIKRGRFGNVLGAAWHVPTHDDYKAAVTPKGYDRGHMVPFADFEDASVTMDMVNVVPQNKSCNQRVWQDFEDDLRESYQGHVCVTIAVRVLDGWEPPLAAQPAFPEGLRVSAGLCKVILRFDGTVEYWGCVRHDPETCARPYEDFDDDEMRYKLGAPPRDV